MKEYLSLHDGSRVSADGVGSLGPDSTRPQSATQSSNESLPNHVSNGGAGAATIDAIQFPCTGWKALQKARSTCPEFSISTILSFFLDSRERDGKPSANFKAVVGDNNPIRLFQAGWLCVQDPAGESG